MSWIFFLSDIDLEAILEGAHKLKNNNVGLPYEYCRATPYGEAKAQIEEIFGRYYLICYSRNGI